MVQYRRNRLAGGTFFFTVTLRDRRATILIDHVAVLREAFQDAQVRRPFRIDAVVVLPDHLHAIWTLPPDDADFSARWRRIKAFFTSKVVSAGLEVERDARGEYVLWQRRFWEHTIRNEADMCRCVDYIHFNPVKHELVTKVVDWPHSSFHRYVRAGLLPADWGGDLQEIHGSFGEPVV